MCNSLYSLGNMGLQYVRNGRDRERRKKYMLMIWSMRAMREKMIW